MKAKRGQLFAEPFMWILALVVGALILIYGFYMISNLIKTNEKATMAKYVLDLRHEVRKFYYFDAGSSELFKIRLPSKIKRACFYTGQGSINRQLISPQDAFQLVQSSSNNMFIMPLDAYGSDYLMYNIDGIKVNNFVCFDNNKDIKLVSEGTSVLLTQPSN